MIPVTDAFMAGVRPSGLQRGRGGFLRSADDSPYVSDPTGATVKSGERKGEVCRLKYGSPSNRGREIEADAGLIKWKQRRALLGIGMADDLAQACRDLSGLTLDSPEFNSAADAIMVAADKLTRSELAADRGTHGHLLLELVDRGEDIDRCIIGVGEGVGLDQATQTATVDAWRDMLHDNGLEVLAIEASCVDDTWRLAGTLDRIVRITKPLTFAKSTGELVTIPANTVLVLDLKFGKCRKAHPIQIASYAQSVPYDTETETRDEWPWPIDQTHALIAHGDFGDDTRPPTIELVWVDLHAGRTHGGQCVVDAKAWAARDDVFSVSQLDIDVDAIRDLLPERCATPSPVVAATATGEGAAPVPSSPSPVLTYATTGPHANGGNWPLADPDRLALVDARAQLATEPAQGADLTDDEFAPLWDQVRGEYAALDAAARAWVGELSSKATRQGLSFHTVNVRTVRSYNIARALVSLCQAGCDRDEVLRALLCMIVGDVAVFVGVHPGHCLGSLNAIEAERLATLVDAFCADRLIADVDDDGVYRLRERAA